MANHVNSPRGAVQSLNFVWDINTLVWAPESSTGGPGGGGAVTVADGADVAQGATTDSAGDPTVVGQLKAVKLSTDHLKLTPISGSANGLGNNLILTPTAGKKLRIHYLGYNPSGAVEAAFRFGAGGQLFLRTNLTAGGSVISKDFGDFRYVEGATDESLYLNLSGATATIWNAFYEEV